MGIDLRLHGSAAQRGHRDPFPTDAIPDLLGDLAATSAGGLGGRDPRTAHAEQPHLPGTPFDAELPGGAKRLDPGRAGRAHSEAVGGLPFRRLRADEGRQLGWPGEVECWYLAWRPILRENSIKSYIIFELTDTLLIALMLQELCALPSIVIIRYHIHSIPLKNL